MTLVQHVARQHGNDGNYQCGLCQELESTEPTGIGYVCCVCDVVFDVPRDLEDHMATHDLIWILLPALSMQRVCAYIGHSDSSLVQFYMKYTLAFVSD